VRNLVQEISIIVAYPTIIVSGMRNLADDGDDDLAVATTNVLSALNNTVL